MNDRWAHGSDRPVRTEAFVVSRPLGLLVAGRPTSYPSIAMLPGLGYTEMLFPLIAELSVWTRATLLDLPGWKRQRARASEPTIRGIAEAAADWLRQAGGPAQVLLGHSTGAQAALQTALLVPDRVRALVLVGPTLEPGARSWPRLVARFCRPLWREPPAELAAVRRSLVSGGISPVVRLIASAIADRPEQFITQVSVPTVILAGEHDRVASPIWCREMADLAGSRLRVFPGGHNFCFPYAAMVGRAVREIVNDWRE